MAGTDLNHRFFAYLLKVGGPSLERNGFTQPRAGEVEEIADHPLHALSAAENARHDPASSLRIVLGHSQEGSARRNGAERRAQVVAEHADELIPKTVRLNREPIHRLRQRFVNRFIESANKSQHLGCFAIAALMHAALTLGWPPTVRAAATIGFIGGLTTYSSFNYETMRLFEEGAPATAFLNLGLTVMGGFMAGWLGLVAAREVLGR